MPRPGDSRLVTPIRGRKGDPAPAQPEKKPPAAMKRMDMEDAEDDDEEDDNDVEKEKNAAKVREEAKKPEGGPKLPRKVDSARINKSALYHFQNLKWWKEEN